MQTARTTLNLPKPLIRQVKKELGVKTQTQAIIMSLQEMLRRRKTGRLIDKLAGSGGTSLTQAKLRQMRRERDPWTKF